jgi:hypothetical protein
MIFLNKEMGIQIGFLGLKNDLILEPLMMIRYLE